MICLCYFNVPNDSILPLMANGEDESEGKSVPNKIEKEMAKVNYWKRIVNLQKYFFLVKINMFKNLYPWVFSLNFNSFKEIHFFSEIPIASILPEKFATHLISPNISLFTQLRSLISKNQQLTVAASIEWNESENGSGSLTSSMPLNFWSFSNNNKSDSAETKTNESNLMEQNNQLKQITINNNEEEDTRFVLYYRKKFVLTRIS